MIKATAIVLAAILIAAAEDDDWFTKITQMRITGELRKACSQTGNPVQPVTRVNTTTRLAALRHLMINETITKIRLDAYIIPSQDDHQTEFVSEHDQRRWFISGFSGSYGDAVVTATKAVLWTDARYHLQADDQADCNWLLMKENYQSVPSTPQWLVEQFPKGATVGVDPKLIAQSQWVNYHNYFQGTEVRLVEVDNNLVDLLWNETNGRPEERNKDVFILEEKYAGKKWISKVHELRTRLMHFKADAMVVTALDEIAWLLNIRGRDIPYSPFVRSYLLVEMQKIFFFVNESQLAKNKIQKHFEKTRVHNYNKIEVLAYEDVCQNLSSRALLYKRVLIPSQSLGSLGASRYIYSCVSRLSEKKILRHESPIIFLKAKKNAVEIQGMYNAHIRDAAAMCEFFSYFETRVSAGDTFTELDVVKILNEFRFEQKDSLGNSFRTIAAYGSNGAMIHYEPNPSTNAVIFKNSTLVLDSGGQYFDGTTDVTRTLHLGTPTWDQRDAYTRVLIGQIQLSTLTFPENMLTSVADVMVRAPLWEVGLDYNHGTSHGVGSFLSVHEPPISMHFNNFDLKSHYKLRPGYFLSNEPGFYREGDFGVRLENVMEVVNKTHLSPIDGRGFLGFKVITLVPYENKLIDFSLLSVHHVRWLNSYNDQIRKYVGAELRRQKFINGYNWMMQKTEYIPECGRSAIFKSWPTFVLTFNVVFVLLITY